MCVRGAIKHMNRDPKQTSLVRKMWKRSHLIFATFLALWSHVDAATHQVSTFSELSSAISSSSDGDVVELTANIDVTNSLTISNRINITSAGTNVFYLDGGENNRIFTIFTSSAEVGFSNIKFQNGYSSSNGGEYSSSNGGAIYIHYGTASFDSCTFDSNSASYDGGAIYDAGGTATFDSCTFESNSANNNGGAIFNWEGTATFDSCTFDSNSANNHGGAIVNNGGGTATFDSCTFDSNTGYSGGAISIGSDVTVTFDSCTFDSNEASGYGGAIYKWGGTVLFNTTCPNDEFATGTGKVSYGFSVYSKNEDRFFSSDLIDGDNCKPCPSGLENIGAGCGYPMKTFGMNFLPCTRFWYYDPWNSTCGAFRIMSIIFLCGFGILSVYIHARLVMILRDVKSDSDSNSKLWMKYKLNMLVFFAQLDLAGDTVYLSYEVFATPLLELIGLVVYLLPTAVFMISQRTIVNRHLCLFLRPVLQFYKYDAVDEFYKLVLTLLWFIAFSWFIVPVVFVYYLVLFVFVSSKLMCIVSVAESFINFGLDEDKKQKMAPTMANRMFNGSVFTELTIDTIPQLIISVTNAIFLKTTNGLFFFQVITSSLVILNEVYPFVHGAIKHKSLVKALENRDHKLLKAQSGFLDGNDSEPSHITSDVSVELGKVYPESAAETQTHVRDVTPSVNPTNDIVQDVRKLQREMMDVHEDNKHLHDKVIELEDTNKNIVQDIRDLRTEIEPLLSGHDL